MKNLLIILCITNVCVLGSCKKKSKKSIVLETYKGYSSISKVSSTISSIDGTQTVIKWDTTYVDVLSAMTNFENDSITFTSTPQNFFTCPKHIISWLRNENYSRIYSIHEFESFTILNDSITHEYSNYGGGGLTYNSYSFVFKGSKK